MAIITNPNGQNHQPTQISTRSTSALTALDFASILKASQALSSEINLDKLLTTLLNTVIANAGASKCVLMLLWDGGLQVAAVTQLGQEPRVLQAIPVDESRDVPVSLIHTIKHTLQTVIIDEATKEASLFADPYIIQQQPQSLLCMPIVNQGKLLSILYLENRQTTGAFTKERVEILNLLCCQAAISLENARLYEQLKHYSHHLEIKVAERTVELEKANQELYRAATVDGLTLVANRRRFDFYLQEQWQQFLLTKQPLGLLLCDIDYFKYYNDYYGHQAGDECLKQVAQMLSLSANRSRDLVARYGGEEFAIILPDTNMLAAKQVAKRIGSNIKRLQLPHAKSPIGPYITLSIGISSIVPDPNTSWVTLISNADEALYQAKNTGRNRYCIYSQTTTAVNNSNKNSNTHPTVQIPNYQILSTVYSGSRTLVYRGIRNNDQLPVIIKLLKNEYPTFSELVQFRNQYTIAKNLNSLLIIQTYSLEPYQNGYVLVMEDFGGISLHEWLVKGGKKISLREFLVLAIDLCNVLDTLYRDRIIHKDIKPSNILINPETKQIKLIDFSIASLLPRETQTLINPNVLEGTLAYISPEQTGRMNRGIDYRTDFYSLGVTFYELLTRQLPFVSDDPMELVHCHLAKQPISVHQIKPEIPIILSQIVSKLMAKNAENRYQSALGLKHDLEICLAQLQPTGNIETFGLGTRDITDRFLIPEKLYGRDTEVDNLLAAFERVSQGRTEMMLVAGFSGIGKTAVVNEVHKPIVRQRGYFIKGKFDQFNRNIPLSAFVRALRDLMGQLLSESDGQLATGRVASQDPDCRRREWAGFD